jgi:hypothetical protein
MSIIDGNRIPVMKAALNTDGVTLTNVTINETNNALKVDDNTTGDDNSTNENALRNQNYKTGLWATSSEDGVTPVQLYCDADGKLLINSA